jgi:sirohydrochlorin cobaltochelatase
LSGIAEVEGILLFAHGARDPLWARPFEEVARRIAAQRPDLLLTLAYLEFMQPGLEEAANGLAQRGCKRIHIVPMFLGAGGHVRKDIPPLIERLRGRHGEAIEWILHPALGDQDRVMQAMTDTTLSLVDKDKSNGQEEER